MGDTKAFRIQFLRFALYGRLHAVYNGFFFLEQVDIIVFLFFITERTKLLDVVIL